MARPDPSAPRFHFPIGALVRWAEDPTACYSVRQRRWTERELLEPVTQYLLERSQRQRSDPLVWAYEPDLLLWEAAAP